MLKCDVQFNKSRCVLCMYVCVCMGMYVYVCMCIRVLQKIRKFESLDAHSSNSLL